MFETNYSCFSKEKHLLHWQYWQAVVDTVQQGFKLPPPLTITIDPISACNLSCVWCNGGTFSKVSADADVLISTVQSFVEWGVKSVCIAGGGEPLLHPDITRIVKSVSSIVDTSVITNGTQLTRILKKDPAVFDKCRFVGVSVDAVCVVDYADKCGSKCYSQIKDTYNSVIAGIAELTQRLPADKSGGGVGYKYLLNRFNVDKLSLAFLDAVDLGCSVFQARPVYKPEGNGTGGEYMLTVADIPILQSETNKIYRYLETHHPNILVNVDTSKFRNAVDTWGSVDGLQPIIRKKPCWAILTNTLISPSKSTGYLNYQLCCDTRYNPIFSRDYTDCLDFREFWGSNEHLDLAGFRDNSFAFDCPRCVMLHRNEICNDIAEGLDLMPNML